MKKYDHEIHKYSFKVLGGTKVDVKDGKKVLVKTSGYPICKCMLPNCPHYLPYELAIGRVSLCWGCGQEMILTSVTAKMKKPVHDHCKRKRRVA